MDEFPSYLCLTDLLDQDLSSYEYFQTLAPEVQTALRRQRKETTLFPGASELLRGAPLSRPPILPRAGRDCKGGNFPSVSETVEKCGYGW